VWWTYLIVVVVIAAGIYGFVVLTKTLTHRLSSHSDRRAEDLYDSYADRKPPRDA
jgi:hypothetical protein